MPRRNLVALFVIAVVSLVCYRQADSAHRSRYGRMFDTFTEVLEEVEKNYVEPVDDRQLFQGALEGMVSRLDPYSAYLGPTEARESREGLDQKFGGIGIEVGFDRDTKLIVVLNPIVGTPAYEAGIQPGDKILKIGDENAEGFTLEDATERLRGPPGDLVRLSLLREGHAEPVEVSLRRAVIHVDTVLGDRRRDDGKWEFLLAGADGIGYIRLTSFSKQTASELQRALEELRRQKLRGLILDLRNNGGGLLSAAVEICDLFVRQGRIVSTRGRGGKELETYDASGDAPYTDFPIVVLVNRFSASASEIVAACLQDDHRATIAGERSFGKGTVQTVIPLERGKSELRLTTAAYVRPSGKNIHRGPQSKESDAWGVSPDEGLAVKRDDAVAIEAFEDRRQRDRLPMKGKAPPTFGLPVDPVVKQAVTRLDAELSVKR